MKRAVDATPNKYLIAARLNKNLLQRDVAALIGTTPVNISRWEGGITVPGTHFRHQLSVLFGKSEEELGLCSDNISGSSGGISLDADNFMSSNPPELFFPYKRNPLFTGREQILQQLHTQFWSANLEMNIQALCGLGGIGKTQIALEYAYRYRKDYQTVLCVRAISREVLLADLTAIVTSLHLSGKQRYASQYAQAMIKGWLSRNCNWLLIVDDIEDLNVLGDFLPPAIKGHVLLTTNTLVTGTVAQPYYVEGLEPDSGALFLLKRAKYINPMARLEDVPAATSKQAQEIVYMLGGHPLALDQAGAYIEETACSLEDYLHNYREHSTALLDLRGTVTMYHPASVAATISRSIERAQQAYPATAELLRLCTLMPDTSPISEETLVQQFSRTTTCPEIIWSDSFILNEAIKELRRYSLIGRNPCTKKITIPPLVRTIMLSMLSNKCAFNL